MLSTPKHRATVVGFAGFLFLTAPAVAAWYFRVQQIRGSYPVDADSIGIPVFSFIVLQLLAAPLIGGFIWLCVRRYPGGIPLTVWNWARPVWSIMWSVFTVGAAAALIALVIQEFGPDHPIVIAHIALDAVLLLVLRSAIVAQGLANEIVD